MLTTKQRAQLRALANPLADTLIIGKEGVTDAVERQQIGRASCRERV